MDSLTYSTTTLCGGEPRNAPAAKRPTAPRRGVLAALLALPAAAGAGVTLAAPAAVPSPDAALLAACTELARCFHRLRALDACGCPDDTMNAAYREYADARDQVTDEPATTMAGARAKARALVLVMRQDMPELLGETVEEVANPHELLAWALAHELAELGDA